MYLYLSSAYVLQPSSLAWDQDTVLLSCVTHLHIQDMQDSCYGGALHPTLHMYANSVQTLHKPHSKSFPVLVHVSSMHSPMIYS